MRADVEGAMRKVGHRGWGATRTLDALARPRLSVLGRERSSFHVCGLAGLALALALGAGLTAYRGLALWVLGAAVLTAVATFLALALVTKLIVGEERLIYYHHEVAILATVTLMLWLLDQTVLAYLDATVLGVGTFLFCGRVGCFMVGCCHGRPHRHGVCYRREHADAGFTPVFVGVRLFPIQLVESAWVFAAVVAGVGMALRGAAPGVALAWYVVVYDVGRFGLEFARGDVRPYRSGFSEAQWTSLLLLLIVVGAELRGAIPLEGWHLAAAAGMVLTMVGVALRRRTAGAAHYRLLGARHIREVAEALERLGAQLDAESATATERPWRVNVARTSAGLLISAGRAPEMDGVVHHYTVSADPVLGVGETRAVTDLVLQLRHQGRTGELVQGGRGLFHLVVRAPPMPLSMRAHATNGRAWPRAAVAP